MALAIHGTRVILEAGNSTSASLSAPTRESGDGLLVCLWVEGSTVTPSTPSGWTLLATATRASSHKELSFGRIADNTATDDFASSWTGSVTRFAEMRKITGKPDGVAKWLVSETNNGSSTTITFKSKTSTTAENLAIGIWNTLNSVTPGAVTSGWTKDGAFWCPVITKTLTSAESTGEPTLAISPTNNWVSVIVIIPPKTVKTVEGESTGEVAFTSEVSGIKNAQGTVELGVSFATEVSGFKTTFGEATLPTKFDFEVTGNKNVGADDITLPIEFDFQADGQIKKIGEIELPVKFEFKVTGHKVTKFKFEPKKFMRVKRRISLVKTRNLRNKRSFRLRGK